jgi:hypothetical protein
MSMTHDELVFIRLILAGTFLAAALSKHADAGSRAPRGAVADGPLRVAEVLVAIALLPGNTVNLGFFGAASLAAGYIAVLAREMSRGAAAPCNCFGALDRDLSPLVSMFRACVLLAIAGAGVVLSWSTAHIDLWVWFGERDTVDQVRALFGAAVAVTAFAVPGRIGSLLARLRRHTSGEPTFHRGAATSGFPPAGPPGVAAPRWPEIYRGERDDSPVILFFLSESATSSLPMACNDMRAAYVTVGSPSVLADEYRVRALPSALLVRADGVVLSRLAVGAAAIASLCSSCAAQPRRGAPTITQLAPAAASGWASHGS